METVLAGTVNVTRSIDVCVEASGDASRIGRVMQAVEAAAALNADRSIGRPYRRDLCDRRHHWRSSRLRSVLATIGNRGGQCRRLIVACPCAAGNTAGDRGLAGPTARRKILIRGSSLQQLAGTGTIWFDKTER
ncbi:hypothetical protein [Rosistilla oblonga]|uniref:hypothetical protein n=1 Tax=Rosistilla oblonga TaxID=2527990 RepID=UPI003A985F0F